MIRTIILIFGLGFAAPLTTAWYKSLDAAIADDTEREFAKDITSMIVESTLKSKCDGNVFVVTKECTHYLDHVLASMSEWAPPVLVTTFHDYNTVSTDRKEFWNTFLSWKRRPCSLIFVCDLIKPRLSIWNDTVGGMEVELEVQEETIGYINYPRFFSSYDQILYFSFSFPTQLQEVINPSIGNNIGGNTSIIAEAEASILKQTGILLSIKAENRSATIPETVMRVYSKCNFCGPVKKRQEIDLGFWQRNKTQFGKFFEVFDNYGKISFNSSNLTVGYFNYPPHFDCTIDINSTANTTVCAGVEWDIISQIGKSLNFEFTLMQLETGNDSVKTKSKNSPKINPATNYSGMIQALQDDRIDLAVGGISVTSERIAMVDFSKVFVTEPIVFVVEKSNNIFVLGIWLAFQPAVWPVILLLVAIISFLFRYIINRKIYPHEDPQTITRQKLSLSVFLHDPNRIPNNKKPAHVRIFEALEITLQPLVGQPLNTSQISSSPRRLLKLLLIIWWFSCLIITTLYNTSLITSLINPVTAKEPESLQDLIDFGYRFKLGCKHNSVYELITSITDDTSDPDEKPTQQQTEKSKENAKMSKLLRQIKDKLIIGDVESNGLVAYITEESAITTKPGLTCGEKKIGFTKTKIIRERLFLTGYGFALKPQAAYKEKIDTALARLGAGGLIDHWYSTYRLKDNESTESKFRLRKKLGQIHLDLEILQGAFIFLLFGCSFAGIVFGIEHFTKRYTFRFYTKDEILYALRFLGKHATWFYKNHVAEKPPVDKKKKKNQEKFRNVVHTVVNLNSKQQYKFLK